MKCLRKYKWVKLPRMHLPGGKGLMGYWAKLASRAAFRKGNAVYCGHINPVTAGMWSGGVVGLKSILGVKKRVKALWIMNQLQDLGYISYSLDPKTKQLTYQINDWVLKCSGAECKDGAVYATEGYGFLCINVMEIRHTISPEMELIDEVDYNDMDSMLARKIQQLMIIFSLLIPDMTNEEEQMLDEALIKTYNEFGITHDNNSLYADNSVFPPKLKKMPILGDLHKHLLENPMTARVAAIVSRFVTGSAQSFNRQTNVDLTNKYIVLDLSELKGKLLPVGMMIALDYVWDNIKADRTKRKLL